MSLKLYKVSAVLTTYAAASSPEEAARIVERLPAWLGLVDECNWSQYDDRAVELVAPDDVPDGNAYLDEDTYGSEQTLMCADVVLGRIGDTVTKKMRIAKRISESKQQLADLEKEYKNA